MKESTKQLNAEQLQAAFSSSDNVVTIASAGSGKTKTLVERVEMLVEGGANPRSITVITYTVAAAAELASRLSFRLGFTGTLHSFCIRLIKENASALGLPETISVLDDEQRQEVAMRIAAEMNCKTSWKALDALLSEPRLAEPVVGDKYDKAELVAVQYHLQTRRSGVLDFDAILRYGLKVANLMKRIPGQPQTPTCFWRHLFVDEYQDAADIDAQIYETLPAQSKFFVGDPDQAIYGFRGGNVANILRLGASSPAWAIYTLQTNYRCRQKICDAAQRLIVHNSQRYPKATVPATVGGEIVVRSVPYPGAEQAFICEEIMRARGGADEPTIAVLCRTHRVADGIREFLEARGVKLAVREREETPPDWKLAKLLITLRSNPWNDFVAFQYLCERNGREHAETVRAKATKAMLSINESHFHWDTRGSSFNEPRLLASEGIGEASIARITDACRRLESVGGEWDESDLIALLNSDERPKHVGAGVVVTTMHAAKGLEFDFVFMAGCEQGTIPSSRKDTDIEEERRLAYVAMTRARSRLFIIYCATRPKPFGHGTENFEPSQFIAEAGL